MTDPANLSADSLDAIGDALADERRIIEDYRGAVTALETARRLPAHFTETDVARRVEAVRTTQAAYLALMDRTRKFTPEEEAAIRLLDDAVRSPWWRERTREAVRTVLGAVRRG